MRILDTYLTGVLAGHGLHMSWGFSSVAAVSTPATCPAGITLNANRARVTDKQRSPGTQEVPL